MIEIEISLRRARKARPVHAWYLPAQDAARVVRAVAEAGSKPRIFAVARSAEDNAHAGFLIVARDTQPGRIDGAIALTRVGARLFVPCDAEVEPPLDAHELDELLDHHVNLLLPGGRFQAYAVREALAIASLLTPPARIESDWSRARPGTRLAPRLVSVEAEASADLQAFFAESKGDIRVVTPEDLAALPPDGAPEGRASDPVQRAKLWIARAAFRIADLAPKKGSRPTWIDRVMYWGQQVMVHDLHAKREEEIRRLLKLLEEDPALGLRFALPIGGDEGRGVARPSDKLDQKDPRFDMDRLNKSGRVDHWRLDDRRRFELATRYRALAAQEIALGRHRRAAYIYAHLLGDFAAAAKALSDGRHFVEAGTLYRDRLTNRAAAADAFESAGQFEESIRLWISTCGHDRAAQLLERLGRTDEARAQWSRQADHRLSAGDALGAARIHDEELGDVKSALRILEDSAGKPLHAVAARVRWIEILVREQRSSDAIRWVEGSLGASHDPANRRTLAETLTRTASAALPAELRGAAADHLRVLVGHGLKAEGKAARDLLDFLPRANNADPLLRRDRGRYANALRTSGRKPRAGFGPTTVSTFSIGAIDAGRTALASNDEMLFVIRPIAATGRPILEAWSWRRGTIEATWEWPDVPAWTGLPWIALAEGPDHTRALVGPHASNRVWSEQAPRKIGSRTVVAGSPLHLPLGVLGIAGGHAGSWSAVGAGPGESAICVGYNADGSMFENFVVAPFDELSQHIPVPVLRVSGTTLIGMEDSILETRTDGKQEWNILGSHVRRIVASPTLPAGHVVIVSDTVGVYDVARDPWKRVYAEEVSEARVAVLGSGVLAVAGTSTLSLAEIRADRRQRIHHGPLPGERIVEVLPAAHVDEFALVTESGQVIVQRVARP